MFRFFIVIYIFMVSSIMAEGLKSFYVGLSIGYNKINPKDVNDDNKALVNDLTINNITRASTEEYSMAGSSYIEFGYLYPMEGGLILDTSLSYNYIISNKIKQSLDYVSGSGHTGNIFNIEASLNSSFIMLREALIFKGAKESKIKYFGGLGIGYSFGTYYHEKAAFNKDNYLAFVGENPPADYEGDYKGTNPVYEIFFGNKYQFTNSVAASFKLGYRVLKCSKLNATKAFGLTDDNESYKDRNDNVMEFDLSGVFINVGVGVYF